jgi:hypothetical protein
MKDLITRRRLYRETSAGRNLHRPVVVLSLVSVVVSVGCTAPALPPRAPELRALPPVRTTTRDLGAHGPLAELDIDPSSVTVRALAPGPRGARRPASSPRPRHDVWTARSPVAPLTNSIIGARHVRGEGDALAAALAALPEGRRALGLSGLTAAQLFGASADATGLCASPGVELEIQHQGAMYEARYRTDPRVIMTEPEPSLYALSSTCTAALSARGLAGAVGGGCTVEDEAAHFAAGSACRACLATDGDHARCLASAACPAQTSRTMSVREAGRTVFYDVLEATSLACAPDVTHPVIILTRDMGPSDTPPRPFDHTQLSQVCGYFWSTSADEPRLYCSGNEPPVRLALADVLIMRVDHLRRAGDTRRPLAGRVMVVDSLEVEGVTYGALPLYPGTFAEVSEADVTMGGYGLVPGMLRPGGTDPDDVDHTLTRDWLATVAMKATTTINGVPFAIYNKNLCATDGWRGPDARGRYYCPNPGFYSDTVFPPDPYSWQFDYGAFYVGLNPTRVESLPTVTLGSTGLVDPNIPGGHVIHVAGTSVLADPEWESCAWAEQFEPDETASVDSGSPGLYTFTAQTYRFGKDPRRDLRVVLATNWRRGFCAEPL